MSSWLHIILEYHIWCKIFILNSFYKIFILNNFCTTILCPPESGANCKVEAEECDTYEEGNDEPVAMIEESPPDVEQDG